MIVKDHKLLSRVATTGPPRYYGPGRRSIALKYDNGRLPNTSPKIDNLQCTYDHTHMVLHNRSFLAFLMGYLKSLLFQYTCTIAYCTATKTQAMSSSTYHRFSNLTICSMEKPAITVNGYQMQINKDDFFSWETIQNSTIKNTGLRQVKLKH